MPDIRTYLPRSVQIWREDWKLQTRFWNCWRRAVLQWKVFSSLVLVPEDAWTEGRCQLWWALKYCVRCPECNLIGFELEILYWYCWDDWKKRAKQFDFDERVSHIGCIYMSWEFILESMDDGILNWRPCWRYAQFRAACFTMCQWYPRETAWSRLFRAC